MLSFTEFSKVVRFGLLGAAGSLIGWLVGEPLLALGLPSVTASSSPSLVTRSGSIVPPPGFKERLEKTNAKTGDIQISLIWDNRHDLDLHCIDPSGEDIYFNNRVSSSGGRLDVDSNAGCEKDVRDAPVENIYWASGTALEGEYKVVVHFFTSCPREVRTDPNRKDFTTPFRVRVLVNGEEKEFPGQVSFTRGLPLNNHVLVHTFRIGPLIKVEVPPNATILARSTMELPFRLTRVKSPGAATVTASNLPEGMTADSVVVPAGETLGRLKINSGGAKAATSDIELTVTADSLKGTAVMPLTVLEGMAWSWWLVVLIGIWTALLAVGLTAALMAGQNRYLGRLWNAGGLNRAVLGAAGAGIASGMVGQALYFIFALVSPSLGGVGFFAGWLLLGALLGLGLSLFIPNLNLTKATLAGLIGGGLGAAAFLAFSLVFADWLGRFAGASILGFAIGLMVALVEVAYRQAWLEVVFGSGELITVNLGPEPVKVGEGRECTVWARGAPKVALRYWLREGRVICDDVEGGREQAVGEGDKRVAGSVTVVVRTSGGVRSGGVPPAPPAQPAPSPSPVDAPEPPAPPLRRPARAAVQAAAPEPPAATAPPKPPAATPPPKPVTPLAAATLNPPAPPAPPKPLSAPNKAIPPAPVKPTGATSTEADRCPNCDRKAPGPAGKRYCLVCDHFF
jgi:hypothetical protein